METFRENIVTVRDIYCFYTENRSLTQTKVIEAFLASKYGITKSKVRVDEENAFEAAIGSIQPKLSRLVDAKNKSKLKSGISNNATFLELKEFPILLNIYERQQHASSSSTANENFANEAWHGLYDLEGHSVAGEKKHMFFDLSDRQKRRRADHIYQQLNEWASEENVKIEKIIAYLGYRSCWSQHNPKLANIFKQICLGENPEEKKEVPMEKAIYLKEAALIGKRMYTNFRLLLKEHVIFPPYDKVAASIHQTLPKIVSFREGIRCDVMEVATNTLSRLPLNVVSKISSMMQAYPEVPLVARFSCGLDGSGGHSIYNSKQYMKSSMAMSNYIVVGMCLNSLRLDDNTKTKVYSVAKTCSFNNERPIAIYPGKEDRESLKDILSLLDIGIYQGATDFTLIDFGTFKCNFIVEIKLDQIDTKTIKAATGLTGAYCTSCTVSSTQAHDVEGIRNGFKINRTLREVEDLFNELCVLDVDGNEHISKNVADYNKRKGVCMKPITRYEMFSNITVLHSYLNSLSFFQRILYCINSGVLKMGSRFTKIKCTRTERELLAKAKKRIQEKAKHGPLSMKFDMPDASGHGGTSDTGNVARKFFSIERRNDVLDLIEPKDEPNLAEDKRKYCDLLQRFSIILRIVSSKDSPIYHTIFDDYCRQTYAKVIEYFSWAVVPGTIHRLLAHSAEKIHLNENYGLGALSEESLEVVHKKLRKFRELGARKCGLKENLVDVFTHWWIQSDPTIQSIARDYKCNNCFELYHTKRSCQKNKGFKTKRLFEVQDDYILNEFLNTS